MTDTNWAPSRIWLQRGVGEEGSHTWCEDSIDDCEQAEYVRVDSAEPVEMALCSTEQVFLKPNQLYRFYVKEGCAECAHIADPTTAPPPASTNRLTAEITMICNRYLVKQGNDFELGGDMCAREVLRAIIAATEGK